MFHTFLTTYTENLSVSISGWFLWWWQCYVWSGDFGFNCNLDGCPFHELKEDKHVLTYHKYRFTIIKKVLKALSRQIWSRFAPEKKCSVLSQENAWQCRWNCHSACCEEAWGKGVIASCILNLDNKWRWVVTVTPQLLYPWRESLWYPLNRRLGGPKIWCECFSEVASLLALLEI